MQGRSYGPESEGGGRRVWQWPPSRPPPPASRLRRLHISEPWAVSPAVRTPRPGLHISEQRRAPTLLRTALLYVSIIFIPLHIFWSWISLN